jgi:23S rRNA (adenine2503-C2)-methyltransferase
VTRPILGLQLEEIKELIGHDQPAFRGRQLYDAIYRRKVSDLAGISDLPGPLRLRLARLSTVGYPEIAARYESTDGTERYLLRLDDGRTVETVWMPEESRDTVCISSQVGCPVNCGFCLTALMGLERNLTAGEIVGQVLLLAARYRVSPRESRLNVVMMGMGEPLLNLDSVLKATRLLVDPDGVGMSQRRITLSTAGVIPKIRELGRASVRPKLAVSLNASTEEQRRELMPITRKYHLHDLLEACRNYPLHAWERLTFEYVLLKNFNDSDADARRLVRLISNLRCKVNLIALNPGPGIPYQTPTPERVHAFQAIVRRSVPCFIRKPRGRDIYAACGQLKRISGEELVSIVN